MTIECPKCQTNNPDDSKFCKECATPLPESGEASHTKTLETPTEELTRGSVFAGRYEIIEELGKGGMGRVYRVLDTKLNEEIALKLIKPEIASNKKTIERFRNELKIARKIVQKNVGRMFDLNEEKDTHYITMEYIPGQDLKGLIRQSGRLAIPTAISIAKQVCDGLIEAHRISVIHRDLKPSNIMIDKEGNARIMDFGIALSLEAKDLTGAGVIIGTPKYMSPEQMEGKEVDQQSDIYSLGVLLYEMATSKVPFMGDSSLSIAMQHKLDSPKPPMELNHRVPKPLNRLILKCLAKKKENRYQSVDEILTDLKVIEDDLTTGEKQIPLQKTGSTSLMTSIKTFKVPGYLIMGALILLVLAYFIGKGLISEDRPIRIVIFPFEYLGPDPDENQHYIRDYLAIRIGVKLQERYEGLIITPEKSAEFYATSNLTNPEIGAELNVDYILNGKIRIDQQEADMSVSIIDAKQNASIEGITLSCRTDEIFDKGVINITDKVGRKLSVASSSAGLSLLQPDSNAMLYFARGWDAERMFLETEDEQDFQAAEQFYLSAVEKQPDYALYSWHLGYLYDLRYVIFKDKSDQQKMFYYIRRAYDLDDNSAETNLGMGWVSFYEGDNDSAYQYFLKAYELDPNKFEVNYHIGGFLRSVGLYEKAIKYYDLALDLNPGELAVLPEESTFEVRIICLLHLERFQQAFDAIEAAQDRVHDNIRVRFLKVHLYFCMGKYAEAEKELAEIQKLNASDPRLPFSRSLLYADNGEREKALEPFRDGFPPEAIYLVTQIYCALGMKEEALQIIQEGIETGLESIQTYLYPYQYLIDNPYYDLLRQEPEFQEIVRAQKQIYDHMVEKYRDL